MGNGVKKYDVVVVGSGSGASIVENALRQGLEVALVDRGPLGGTCLNVGCIPSKILIFPADRLVEIQEAEKLGLEVKIKNVDFKAIMGRMRRIVNHSQSQIRRGIEQAPNLDFYETQGHFVDQYVMEVDGQRIKGDRIFLVSGARPRIPPIEGLEGVSFLTNESLLNLTAPPRSLIIVGGGYIAAEYGHFFAAMGTEVTILQRPDRLVPEEEPRVSDLLERRMAQRMEIHTATEAVAVRREKKGHVVTGRDTHTGEEREFAGAEVLIAAGRTSNADLLRVENAGIETDPSGYIKTNEYLETNVEDIWACGDVNGKAMFTHAANREVSIAWHNARHDHRVAMDYHAVPHAVFSHPQIASVGETEAQAKQHADTLVGEAGYLDVAKGEAMMERDGFAKVIIERESGRILGFHVAGPHAPILIQEVVDVLAAEGDARMVSQAMHIHPALPELVVRALYRLREPE